MDSSFWVWHVLEAIALLLVVIGCAGELWLHHHPAGKKKSEKEQHHNLESLFIAAVAIGVTMELAAYGHSIVEGIRLENVVTETKVQISSNNLEIAKAQTEISLDNWRIAEAQVQITSNNAVVAALKPQAEAGQWLFSRWMAEMSFPESLKSSAGVLEGIELRIEYADDITGLPARFAGRLNYLLQNNCMASAHLRAYSTSATNLEPAGVTVYCSLPTTDPTNDLASMQIMDANRYPNRARLDRVSSSLVWLCESNGIMARKIVLTNGSQIVVHVGPFPIFKK